MTPNAGAKVAGTYPVARCLALASISASARSVCISFPLVRLDTAMHSTFQSAIVFFSRKFVPACACCDRARVQDRPVSAELSIEEASACVLKRDCCKRDQGLELHNCPPACALHCRIRLLCDLCNGLQIPLVLFENRRDMLQCAPLCLQEMKELLIG